MMCLKRKRVVSAVATGLKRDGLKFSEIKLREWEEVAESLDWAIRVYGGFSEVFMLCFSASTLNRFFSTFMHSHIFSHCQTFTHLIRPVLSANTTDST